MKTLAVLALLVTVAAEAPVRINVNPYVLFEGGSVRLRCSVPRQAANRKLTWGIEFYRSSEIQIDGEDSQVTHEWLIQNVPCGSGPAFCRLQRAGERDALVTQAISIQCHN